MDVRFLFRGLLIGFSIAAPVGPIGILCIRRSLARGQTSGFMSGLGAATADSVYGSVAAFGLTAISNFLTGEQFWLRLIGGIFLCALGIKTCLSKPATEAANASSASLASDYISTLALTLTNPATILSFAAVFAGLGLGETRGNLPSASLLVMGVFLGSAIWWFILSSVVGLFREKFNSAHMRRINVISGFILFAFGALALFGLRK